MLHEQYHGRAFMEGEHLQGPYEEATRLLVQQEVLRGFWGLSFGHSEWLGLPTGACPGFTGFMPRDAAQPGEKWYRGGKAHRLLPHHQHNVMAHLLGECRVIEEMCQVAPQARHIPSV
jgi:hypothetical protein